MIELKQRTDGVSMAVKVQPGARRTAIIGEHAGALKVAVNAAPEHGRATAAVTELLASKLNLPRTSFTLLSGATSRQKLYLVMGIDRAELQSKLAALVAAAVSPKE